MSPFGQSNVDNNSPVDANTQWIANHYNYDRTMEGQRAALFNDQPLNFGSLTNASENDYLKFKMQMAGVHQVKGALQAGIPVNQIEAQIAALETKPNLSPIEDARVKYWKSFKYRLSNEDGFYDLVNQTVIGKQNAFNHQSQKEAIIASGKQGAELFNALRENDNNYIGQSLDTARAIHLDPSLVRPIFANWVNEVKASFQNNAPVLPALQRIAYINPEYRAFLAKDRKSTRLNSSHVEISYAVFCLKKKKKTQKNNSHMV